MSMKNISSGSSILSIIGIVILCTFTSCDKDRNKPGQSYFPDMEQSRAYETYSANPIFADGQTNQPPVENTISRGYIPYDFEKTEENLKQAGEELINPVAMDYANIKEGKRLYGIYCVNCHGINGDGKGNLYTSGKYPYPPASLVLENTIHRPDGEIFHIISVGYGIMGAHQSQINPIERWQIINYIRNDLEK